MLKKAFFAAVIGLDLFLLYWALGGQKRDYLEQAALLQKKQEEGVHEYAQTLTGDFAVDSKLWMFAIELLDGPKDRPSVIRKAKSWLPQAFNEEQGGFIQDVSFRKSDNTKADRWKVAWKKNSIVLEFNAKQRLSRVDISTLAGRGFVPIATDEEEEG